MSSDEKSVVFFYYLLGDEICFNIPTNIGIVRSHHDIL